MTKHLNLLHGETLEIKGFDSLGEPTITREENGSLALTFNFMPPDNGTYEENLDMDIFDNFDNELSKVLGVEVVWEDREFFNIPSPKKDTIEILKNYLENFWSNHSKIEENKTIKDSIHQNNTKLITSPKKGIVDIFKNYLENFWKKLSANKTTEEIPLQIYTAQPSPAITLKSLKKEVENFQKEYFSSYKYKYDNTYNTIHIEFNEVVLSLGLSCTKHDPGVFSVFPSASINHNLVNKYIGLCHFYPEKNDRYTIITNFPNSEDRKRFDIYIRSIDNFNAFLKIYIKHLHKTYFPFAKKYSTISAIDKKFNFDNGSSPFSSDFAWSELYSIPICCINKNPNRKIIIKNKLKKILDHYESYKSNFILYLLLEGLMQDNLIPEDEFNYYVTRFNLQNHLEL